MRSTKLFSGNDSELQRERLQAIIDTTVDPIWSVDIEFNLLTFNAGFSQEAKESVTIGHNLKKTFLFGETIEEYKRAFKGESFEVKKHINLKGQHKILLLSFDPIFTSGRISGCCIRQKDITTQEAIIEKLQDSESKLLEAQQIANMGHWNFDMIANKISWSDQLFKVFGQEKGKFKATYEALMEIIHPEDREAFNFDVERCIKEKIYHDIVHRIIINGDELRYVHQRGKAFYDEKGKPIRMAGTTLDVTKTVQANQKIINQNKELQNFVYVISHNLRRPLANLLGLQALYKKEIDSENDEVLKMMQRSCEALDNTIKDLNTSLTLKKVNFEDFKIIDINQILEDVFTLLDVEIETSGAQITTNLSSVELFGIKSYFVNIFYNLLLNALKYRKHNVDPKIHIEIIEKQESISISVSDNGIGINLTPERKKKVFDMYGRLSGENDGKGLGLYLAKTQVEAMYGEIEVESTPKVGSTFTMRFDRHYMPKPSLKHMTLGSGL